MTFWSNRRVLVTGCSGLIGGYMVKTLLERNSDVVGFDRTSGGVLAEHGIFGQFPIAVGSILEDAGRLEESMTEADIVIHLAADSGVESSRLGGKDAFEANVLGTLNVLEAATRKGVGSVVIASSNHVYGEQEQHPTPETAQLNQLDTYSASKICADYIARAYAHNYGTPTAIVRNTNCYGPIDPHYDHIIPATIMSLINGEGPVIKGTGDTVKSYIHVQDTVDAYLAVAAWVMLEERIGEVFNVADPDSRRSVSQIVSEISSIMDAHHEAEILHKQNDQNDEHLSIEKIKAEIGWGPRYTLSGGLLETAEYLKRKHVPIAR